MKDIIIFNKILEKISDDIKQIILKTPDDIKVQVREIRLRENTPICLITGTETFFLDDKGNPSRKIVKNCFKLNNKNILETFEIIAEESLHSYQKEIKEGFITIDGGHRVGFCGTAINQDDKIFNLKDINSINFRIAKQTYGMWNGIFSKIFKDGLSSVLVIGPPSSGKTTFLKDIIYYLSSGIRGNFYKVSAIDERGELGSIQYKNVLTCDFFRGYGKSDGVEIAIRTMSPDVIVFDEIGLKDMKTIDKIMHCGVEIITSIHGKTFDDILNKKEIVEMVKSGVFKYGIILDSGENIGNILKVIDFGGKKDESFRNSHDSFCMLYDRHIKI
ncbi:MAG: hypothetical protein KFW09_03735 [Oscillospiraceae bacterium]|nr:hypothetical protein [Oscillospiraceae bacterium]